MKASMSLRKVSAILGDFGFSGHCGPDRVLGPEPSATNADNYEKKQN